MSSPESGFPKPKEQAPPPPAAKIEEIRFEAGVAVREKHKQDAYFLQPEVGAFAVFDGVSDPDGGDIASRAARDYISSKLLGLQTTDENEIKEKIKDILVGSSSFIEEEAKKNFTFGMATTASLVKIFRLQEGKKRAVIANVGDSRVYILRPNGTLEQITIDDSAANSILTGAGISEKEIRDLQSKFNNAVGKNDLSEGEMGSWKMRNIISKALGSEKCEPSIYTVDLNEGDVILLSTDGLHDNLTDSRTDGEIPSIQDILSQNLSAQEMANALLEAAYKRSELGGFRGKPDDITAVVVTPL